LRYYRAAVSSGRLTQVLGLKMRFLTASIGLLFTASVQATVPILQMEQQPSRTEFSAGYNTGEDYVLFAIGDETQRKAYEIIPEHSYVIDPSGKHHSIRVKPHDYDISEKYPFVRDDIFVLRSAASPKPIRLYNGTWSFVLAWHSSGQEQQETFSFRLWTFNYDPRKDGPSN
jgi:hypothetical protein